MVASASVTGLASVSANGLSACFSGTAEAGVRSDVVLTSSPTAFHYIEFKRWTTFGAAFGISGTAPATPSSGSSFTPRADSLIVDGNLSISVDASGQTRYANAGTGSHIGMAVDYRSKYPVVYVLGLPPTTDPNVCPGLPRDQVCVLSRTVLSAQTGSLYLYAYGVSNGGAGGKVSINGAGQLITRPFELPASAVLTALRTHQLGGDLNLDMQWPSASGAAALPTMTPVGSRTPVIRQGDPAPYRSQLSVTTSLPASSITWRSTVGSILGTGASLPMSTAFINSLAPGVHRIVAGAVSPTLGHYVEQVFDLRVLASTSNSDDDGDGLTYSQEALIGTDPGNPDTDEDGLSDGAEAGLGTNPVLADTNGNGTLDGHELAGNSTLPLKSGLAREFGALGTSVGVLIGRDRLSATFTDDVNQDCLLRTGVFSNVVYAPEFGRCFKRAVRADVGVKPGEFRYFETRRTNSSVLGNLGHGLIVPNAMIDPYCCFVSPTDVGYPYTGTPPSIAINSIGGAFVNLSNSSVFNGEMDLNQSVHYGFVVDYRSSNSTGGVNPVVYLVARRTDGSMVVSDPAPLAGFNGQTAFPMIYGHPQDQTVASSAMNLGVQKFHYDLSALRSVFTSRGISLTSFAPGVGVHRWP